MTKPIKADGTSPPIGRFLIGQLIKVNSVRKTVTLNSHNINNYIVVIKYMQLFMNYNILIYIFFFFSLLKISLAFVINWCLKGQILKRLKMQPN